MAVRAMISAIRQLSQNPSMRLRRIVVVDHQTRIKSLSKRVKKYQKQSRRQDSAKSHPSAQLKRVSSNANHIDLDAGDEQSFASAFGVPKIPEVTTGTSDSEPEEYAVPYTDNAKA
jgi:hypothetical protein